MDCYAKVVCMYYLVESYNIDDTWGGWDPENHLFFAYGHMVSNWWGGIQIQAAGLQSQFW